MPVASSVTRNHIPGATELTPPDLNHHRRGRVLVIDDEWSVRDILQAILEGEGYEVHSAENGLQALHQLDELPFDLVFTDLNMPGLTGHDVLQRALARPAPPVVFVITGLGSTDAAMRALRAGAYDYISKPFHLEEIRHLACRAMEHRRLRTENERLRLGPRRSDAMDSLIGQTAAMINLRQMIMTAASGDAPVLILGESGTGKELIARAIHELSGRADLPFIPVHCAAFPEALLEGELFGFTLKGANGARVNQPGRIQAASGGTVFLDEISSLSAGFQARLLRALSERRVTPVGSSDSHDVTARFVASTNHNFDRYIDNGVFRRDIFNQMRILPIMAPPLRDRREDIPLLMARFADQVARKYGREANTFTPEAFALLADHAWPGNVRELENMAERLGAIHPGRLIDEEIIRGQLLGTERRRGPETRPAIPDGGIEFNDLVDKFERDLICEALRKAGGVKNRAATLLNLKRTTLVEKMRKKGMLD